MQEYTIREATLHDIDFIVTAIVEAEKSGSNILSYATVFNLSEAEVREMIRSMLLEEIDGCEFSISCYLIAELNHEPAGTIGAWIETADSPSKTIKSNLLGYYLPKASLAYAARESMITSELIIEHVQDALSLVIVYIAPVHRGKHLFGMLTNAHIHRNSGVRELSIQVMANNEFAIHSYERYGFKKFMNRKCENPEILRFLPFNEKVLLKKTL